MLSQHIAIEQGSANRLIKFKNCRILRNSKIVKDCHLWVRNGKIIDPEKVFFDEKKKAHLVRAHKSLESDTSINSSIYRNTIVIMPS